MMPMALSWCFMCSVTTSLADILLTGVTFLFNHSQTSQIGPNILETIISSSSSSSNGSYNKDNYNSNNNSHTISQTNDRTNLINFSLNHSESLLLTHNASENVGFFHLMWKLFIQLMTKLTIYLTINLVCLYTKYLIDLAQRNAFLETRRSIETRAKIERENDKQERLLLSLLPRFVALEIIADIAKEDNHDKLLKNQFHKIYIHSYSNVR